MPQKKNCPVLERIRGRTAHLSAWYLDVATVQRSTPYSNTVEVSKESSAQLGDALQVLRSSLRLLTEVWTSSSSAPTAPAPAASTSTSEGSRSPTA